MRIKKGVSINGLRIEMRPVLTVVDALWKKNGQKAVITAGTEAIVTWSAEELPFIHSAGSLHPFGLALDFRTRYFDNETKHKVAVELAEKLGINYNVVEHDDRIHAEFNPKFY